MNERRTFLNHKSIRGILYDNPTEKPLKSSVWPHPTTSMKPLLKRASFQPQHLQRIVFVCVHGSITDFIPWHHSGPFHHLLGILPKCWPDKGDCHLSEFFCRNRIVNGRLACDSGKSVCHVVGCDSRAHHKIRLSVGLLDTHVKYPLTKVEMCESLYISHFFESILEVFVYDLLAAKMPTSWVGSVHCANW